MRSIKSLTDPLTGSHSVSSGVRSNRLVEVTYDVYGIEIDRDAGTMTVMSTIEPDVEEEMTIETLESRLAEERHLVEEALERRLIHTESIAES